MLVWFTIHFRKWPIDGFPVTSWQFHQFYVILPRIQPPYSLTIVCWASPHWPWSLEYICCRTDVSYLHELIKRPERYWLWAGHKWFSASQRCWPKFQCLLLLPISVVLWRSSPRLCGSAMKWSIWNTSESDSDVDWLNVKLSHFVLVENIFFTSIIFVWNQLRWDFM